MDEMDAEAKRARGQGPKTGANWDDAHCWTVCPSCNQLRGDLTWTLIPLIYIPLVAAAFHVETAVDFLFCLDCDGGVLLLT